MTTQYSPPVPRSEERITPQRAMELLDCKRATYYELLAKKEIAHWTVRGRRVTTEEQVLLYLDRVGHGQFVPAVA